MMQLNRSMFGLLLGASACTYTEPGNHHIDLYGVVRVPVEATQVTLVDDEGVERVENDPRLLGPVYLGTYASVVEGLYAYPHPEIGPVLNSDSPGDAYPYGGNSVGRFEWGCYQQLACKVVTGRYSSYEDVLSFFRDVVQEPIINDDGDEVMGGTEYQEQCFEYRYYTSDEEVEFIDDGRLDFQLSDDGTYYEAEATIPHTLFESGMTVWGWMDMPSVSYDFATCSMNYGEYLYYYSEQYYVGAAFNDVLNFPGTYIDDGDWVADAPPVLTTDEDEFILELGYHHEG